MRSIRFVVAAAFVFAGAGCAHSSGSGDEHAEHAAADAAAARGGNASATASASTSGKEPLPADAVGALARLKASPRHGEYQMIRTSNGDSVRAFVVFPERSTKAPVVLVVHEIYGLTNWVRAVADQLAAEGFIAIAPDLLTSKSVPSDSLGDPVQNAATSAIRTLDRNVVMRQLRDIGAWGMALPAAVKKYGIVGFCWGGGTSFDQAIAAPELGASVVYYGSPGLTDFASIKAPVLGLYGGADARVNATIPRTDSIMKRLGKTYEPHIFDGAGHGFARQQSGANGANMAAIAKAWPLTVQWFKKYLGS